MSRLAAVIVAFALALVLVACDAEAPPASPGGAHPPTLAGTSWAVVAVDGQRPPIGSRPTMAFDAVKVTGSGGCNGFGGAYRYEPASGTLAFDGLGMTLVGCENVIGTYESRLFGALGAVNTAVLRQDGSLVLSGPGGQIVLAAAGQTVVD
jgi:heat shock protein HslJ